MCKRILLRIFVRMLVGLVVITPAAAAFAWEKREFETVLKALGSPFETGPARDEAAEVLRSMGTNALPFLRQELRTYERIESTKASPVTDRKLQLQAVFEVLGTNAAPLLPELIEDLHAGRNLGVAPYALARIGGEQAGIALVNAMTNSNLQIRISGAIAVRYFETNATVAEKAVVALSEILSHDSGVMRATAADTLGILERSPAFIVPVLLAAAQKDSDPVVRMVALKSLGRFGTNAIVAKSAIAEIANSDKDEDVRRLARQALQAVSVEGPGH